MAITRVLSIERFMHTPWLRAAADGPLRVGQVRRVGASGLARAWDRSDLPDRPTCLICPTCWTCPTYPAAVSKRAGSIQPPSGDTRVSASVGPHVPGSYS